jgi:hypothetical protein
MPGPAAEEDSSASEQGAEDFEDAPSPEPSPEGPPWWQTTIDDLGRGVVAEAGVIQAALQLQSQAVAAAEHLRFRHFRVIGLFERRFVRSVRLT